MKHSRNILTTKKCIVALFCKKYVFLLNTKLIQHNNKHVMMLLCARSHFISKWPFMELFF